MELVEHYLDRVNNGRPHSLFHRRTLRGQVEQSRVKKPLLYAIYAVGARFSANPDVRAWEPRLLAEAKRLLQLGLEDVCLEHIQACILITTMCVDSSNSSEALFHRESQVSSHSSHVLCLLIKTVPSTRHRFSHGGYNEAQLG